MNLSKFWVKNYGTFKKGAEFDLAYKGITTVFGLNRDAGGTSYTNASGKSLLFTALPEIAYGNPPSGKDITKHVKTEIGIEFKGKDDTLTFTKTYGKGKKFEVLKNGKDINVRKLGYAEAKLQALLGGSEEDFYTTRYIDNTIPHPLIVGKAAVRQNFFVSMFNLENVDAVRHLLLAELREVQKVAATYTEVKAMFQDLKGKALKQSEITKKQELIDELKAQQASLLARINKYQVIRDLIRFEAQNKELIAQFEATTSLKTFDSDLSCLKAKRKALREQKEAGQEWETYGRLKAAYTKNKDKITAKIEQLIGADYNSSLVKKKAARYAEVDREYQSVTKQFESLEVERPEKVEAVDINVEKATARAYKLREELDHARTIKNGKCPTCGAPHKTRDVATIKAELSTLTESIANAERYTTYTVEIAQYKKNKVKKLELEETLEGLTSKLEELEANVKALQLIKNLPTKPEKPEGDRVSLEDVETKLDKVSNKLAKFQRFTDVMEQLQALAKVTDEQRIKAKGLDTITDDLGTIGSKLNNLIAEVTAGQEATSQLKKLATRGKVLAKQAEDEPVLKALIEAYSKKGLKKLLIQRYAALLQQQVNKYVRLFFAEDIQFEFRYESKLDVLAHRKQGKKVITTDVKRLSGAEKRMLTLVLVVASISLLPKNKRSNFLVLDEPEANMGPEAVSTFVRALPILNKVIPHIIVITPRPELEIAGSRVFTVVKRNGVSTLVAGKVV